MYWPIYVNKYFCMYLCVHYKFTMSSCTVLSAYIPSGDGYFVVEADTSNSKWVRILPMKDEV